jgi:hypothetical protein
VDTNPSTEKLTVAIAGASGFVGSQLIPTLTPEHRVIGLALAAMIAIVDQAVKMYVIGPLRLREVLTGQSQVQAIHCGHLHRQIVTQFAGIPLGVTPSVAPLVAMVTSIVRAPIGVLIVIFQLPSADMALSFLGSGT